MKNALKVLVSVLVLAVITAATATAVTSGTKVVAKSANAYGWEKLLTVTDKNPNDSSGAKVAYKITSGSVSSVRKAVQNVRDIKIVWTGIGNADQTNVFLCSDVKVPEDGFLCGSPITAETNVGYKDSGEAIFHSIENGYYFTVYSHSGGTPYVNFYENSVDRHEGIEDSSSGETAAGVHGLTFSVYAKK